MKKVPLLWIAALICSLLLDFAACKKEEENAVIADESFPVLEDTRPTEVKMNTVTTLNGNEVTYNFDYPIFSEMGNYTFNLEGYELYTNYEKPMTPPSTHSLSTHIIPLLCSPDCS